MSATGSDDAFSDHFDPNATEELNTDAPGFDFGANLETHDSMSSLTDIGPPDHAPSQDGDQEGGKVQNGVPNQDATPPVANSDGKENGKAAKSDGEWCMIRSQFLV